MKKSAMLAIALTVLSGCGSMNPLTWWRGDPEEQPLERLAGAVIYQCEDKKTLALRHAPQGQSWVMVILPEREFRLDAQAGQGGRFSNGRTTLSSQGDNLALEEGGKPLYAGCRRGA